MENDLLDVGLNALDALEAEDEQKQEDSGEGEDTKPEEAAEETPEGNTDEEKSEANDDGEASEEEPKESESEPEEKAPEEKKEISDEEFEELAKKRGYSKAKTEEETKAEDENAKTMEKLLSRPKEISEEVWDGMSDKNKAIYNSLPYIEALGINGIVRVKMNEMLPRNFVFKDDNARMDFAVKVQAQENRAFAMQQAIEAHEQRVQQHKVEVEEARQTIGEIDELMKSGDLPKPKAKSGTKEFDNDPAVLTINKVLGYRELRAAQGTNLSVRDSLLLYKAEHPEEFKPKEAKGDIERKNISKKIAGNSKATSTAVNSDADNKPEYYRPGMSTEEVLDAIMADMD